MKNVRIGQESVRASLVSLRDARARFQAVSLHQAGVPRPKPSSPATSSWLTRHLARSVRGAVAPWPPSLKFSPGRPTPTAKEPAPGAGLFLVAHRCRKHRGCYAFREELDQINSRYLSISTAAPMVFQFRGLFSRSLSIVNNFLAGISIQRQTNVHGQEQSTTRASFT